MTGTDGIQGDEEPVAETPNNAWDDAPLATEQLALNDEEERLPWLESDDDDVNEGVDSGRIMGFAILAIIALLLLVGGIWVFTHRTADPALVADGSVIAAPGTPYKEAPKDAGGKKFDGTGDSSFAVSEGQTRPAQLGGTTPTPKPSVDIAPKAGASATPAGGVGVQVAAFSSQAAAEAGWAKLAQQYSALSGVPHRVIAGKADIGTVYRLQAVASDAAAANGLCSRLKSAGLSCQVK